MGRPPLQGPTGAFQLPVETVFVACREGDREGGREGGRIRARQLPRDKRQGLPRQDRHRQTEKGGSREAREIRGERETEGGKMRVPPTVPGVFRSLGHCPRGGRGLLSRRRRRRSSLLLFERSAACSCSVGQGGEEGKEGAKGGGKEGGKSAGGRWRRQAPG